MNYIRHQHIVFAKMDAIENIKPTHISLYITLFRLWNKNRFVNPITIFRDEVMKMSKINSPTTYAKVLKDLELYGFIRYHPSYDPNQGSKVHLSIFCTGTSSPSDSSLFSTKMDQIEENEFHELNEEDMNQIKKTGFVKPPLEHIQIYFEQKGYQRIEGEKFFNYYESNCWLVGGKSKMKDWKAAARNWMLNSNKFQSSTTKNTPASKAKDNSQRKQFSGTNYQEPL